MNPDADPELNDLLDRELRQLPMLHAPATLAPRIMAAVRAKAAAIPWWLQPWSEWPMLARAALFIAAILIASIFFGGSVLINDQVRTSALSIQSSPVLVEALSIANAAALLWQKAVQPLFVARLVICAAAFFVCAGLGTAMVRVVARQNLQ